MKSRPNVVRIAEEQAAHSDPVESLRALIDVSRLNLPYEVEWDHDRWDIAGAEATTRAHLGSAKALVFAEHETARDLPRTYFEKPYADLIKALVVQRRLDRGMSSGTQKVFVRASRYLYDALPLSVRRDPTQITYGHFAAAEAQIIGREQPSSAYRAGQFLNEIARMLDRRGLTRIPVKYTSSIRKPQDQYDRTSATFEARSSRLPDADVLNALATIANDPTTAEDPFDELLINIIILLFLGGFRAGELLTLPSNCLLKSVARDKVGNVRLDALSGKPLMQVAIRYWPEKGGEPIPKDILSDANELIERALLNIERLCGPARDNARWLEAHPGRVNLNIADDTILTAHDACKIIGLATSKRQTIANLMHWFKAKHRCHLLSNVVYVRGSLSLTGRVLNEALACDRFDKPVLALKSGQRQTLGHSLFVIFKNARHSVFETCRYISEPVTWRHLQEFIVGRNDKINTSIFERRGYFKEDGTPMRVNTHDFRRLLSTIGERGGLSQVEIAQWMGRRRLQDNVAYDLRSAAERGRDMRDLIKQNEVFGLLADQVMNLPASERDAFSSARLEMVHSTPYGDCGSNIAESPCVTAVSCLGGCQHYLRRKNDLESRRALKKTIDATKASLARANAANSILTPNAANWVREQERIIATATAALAIDDDDPTYVDGEIVQVSPSGPILGRAIEKV